MLITQDFTVERQKNPLKAQRDFLIKCLEENQEDFRRLLAATAIEDPRLFLKLCLELQKLLLPKQQDVNVNLTLNQDFLELKALAESGSTQTHLIDKQEQKLIEYEQLGPNPIESIKTEFNDIYDEE